MIRNVCSPSRPQGRRFVRPALELLEDRRVLSYVLLNEVDANPPTSPDVPWEYVEIRGTPGLALTNLYVVDLEGDSDSDRGNADHAWNLNGFNLGSNGLLVIKSPTGGFSVPAQTTVIGDSVFNMGTSALENGSCTFALISSPTPLIQGQDYDANNNGALELPVGAVVLDSVGWTDHDAGDIVYSTAILTQSTTPDGATRFRDNFKPSSFGAWYNGDIIDVAPWYVDYDPNESSANLPAGGKLTPGDVNSHSQKQSFGGLSEIDRTPIAYVPPSPPPVPPVRGIPLELLTVAVRGELEPVAPRSVAVRNVASSTDGLELPLAGSDAFAVGVIG